MTDSVVNTSSFTLTRLLNKAENSYHEVKLGVAKRYENTYIQKQLLFELDSIHPNGIFSAVFLTLGEPVPEKLATKFKVEGMIGTFFFNRAASMSVSLQKADNGQILDFDLEELTTLVRFNYALNPYLTISLGYTDKDSNIDYFDHKEPSLGIYFSPIEF